MSAIKPAIALLFLLVAFPSVSSAQNFQLPGTTTYCVQVKYEMWRNGAT